MIEGKRIVAIIPARANSQGLPGKNYKEIYGKPLIEWSILAAKKSKYVDYIALTSDCDNCKEIAKKHNLIVIDRPHNLTGSLASTDDTLRHAAKIVKDKHNIDIIVLLQPTSPARKSNLIDRCLYNMIKDNGDSSLTVSQHTPFMWRKKDIYGRPMYDPNNRPMRQELDIQDMMYHDDGNIYTVEYDVLNKMGRVGTKTVLIQNDNFCSMQIDTEKDFRIMESIAKEFGGFL